MFDQKALLYQILKFLSQHSSIPKNQTSMLEDDNDYV